MGVVVALTKGVLGWNVPVVTVKHVDIGVLDRFETDQVWIEELCGYVL